jgi:hypothetical protein
MYATNQRYDTSAEEESCQVSTVRSNKGNAEGQQDLPSLFASDTFIGFALQVYYMARAKSVVHVEFEVFRHVITTIDLADLRSLMVPEGDKVAEARFDKGVKSAAELIANLAMRRQHRLPEDHPAYIAKGE